ncbi:TrbG/VirB9 family P-type conjugative transfer protein [Erythrobacter sp.]|uniref:TrbG/VirB9 family P-type conjugative transfer protein n=1 Tax=Erythrobacter sp. TaxID=1042 RepID=UPI001425DFA2|nr:TrbG/VirB9 family P-type conjugative transfer protein [Erythrobacter sp.]QIQ85476.1 MAG: TrbG/VirB9 family P-type conjugative transfer protein [Erythrobacter sp.]
MKRAFPLALALASLAVPAAAQDSAEADPRLVTLVYDDAQVYTIRGRVKVQTTIKFREDERIENVAIGDSKAWQVQPNKAQSILFVKPLEPSAATNLTVVTSKRTYLFDLVASPRNQPLYVMQFSYPEAEKAEREARLAAAAADKAREEANALEMAAASDPYAVIDPARLNFEWAGEGDRELLPARAYDDGEAVFLTWPAGTPIPAILVTNERGEVGAVNFTVRGDTVVLDDVPGQIVLRSGDDSATLTNLGPARPRSADAGQAGRRGS